MIFTNQYAFSLRCALTFAYQRVAISDSHDDWKKANNNILFR